LFSIFSLPTHTFCFASPNQFEDSLRYRQHFYTEAMAIMTVEEPSRNSMSSCTVM
jgi:hypothetical protein